MRDPESVQNQHGPQLQHSPLPLRKYFQVRSPCCRTVGGNTKQAKRKNRRDGGDHLEDREYITGLLMSHKASILISPAKCKLIQNNRVEMWKL